MESTFTCTRRRCLLALTVLAFGACGAPAWAQFADGFEAYPPGPICGQGGWEEWAGSVDVCGAVNMEQALSGTRSLRIVGNPGGSAGMGDDTVHRFDIAGGRHIVSVRTYVPSAATGRAFVIMLNTYPAPLNWSLQLELNANTNLFHDINTNPPATAPLVRGQWVEVRIDIDLANDRVNVFYGAVHVVVNKSWINGASGGGQARIKCLDLYGDEPGGQGTTGTYFDDVSVLPAGSACPCDWNADGLLNSQDFFDFLTAFFNQDANYNNDYVTNSQDFFDYLICFFGGCIDNQPPLPPTLTATAPPSPADDNEPEIRGLAEGGSTVRLYTNAACVGTPVVSGSASLFAGSGFTVVVPENSTTTFYASATDTAGNTSICSLTGITYVETSPPPSPLLQGPPGDPAYLHIPDVPLPEPPAADVDATSAIPISVRDLMIGFAEATTVAQANALLQSLPATVVAGNPVARLLLVRLVGPSDLDRLFQAWAALWSNPLVTDVACNTGLEPEILPPRNVDTTNSRWTWEEPFTPAPVSGNWGLKAARVPQAWNLADYSNKRNKLIHALMLEAADRLGRNVADATHEDLLGHIVVDTGAIQNDHATMVAGVMGATWDNNRGVEGLYPRTLVIYSKPTTYLAKIEDTLFRLLRSYPDVRVVNMSAGSSGFYRNFLRPDGTRGVDPVTGVRTFGLPESPANPTWRTLMDRQGDAVLNRMRAFERDTPHRDNYLVFCSAGNIRSRPRVTPAADYEARDNSPFANLAIRGIAGAGPGADHFIAVEATNRLGNRADWGPGIDGSAAGGTLSAPGQCVRSTEVADASNYDDRTGCPASDPGDPASDPDQRYATESGTSFATPFAAGLAAYLWSLDPGVAGDPMNPPLTYVQVREAIASPTTRVPVPAGPAGGGNGAERVDAFAAVMSIDLIRNRLDMQRALVDVDDGSLLDGNARIDHDDEDNDGDVDERYESARPPGILRPPGTVVGLGRRGDDVINMKDFRVFRDALLQTLVWRDILDHAQVSLDGDLTHFKRDLNFDGCVNGNAANPPHPPGTIPVPLGGGACAGVNEMAYPRYDFNGNGLLDVGNPRVNPPVAALARFKVDPGGPPCTGLDVPAGCLRDIDVLANPFLWILDEENVSVTESDAPPSACCFICGPPRPVAWQRRSLLADRDGDGNIDYLLSADVHIIIHPTASTEGVIYVKSFGSNPDDPLFYRCIGFNPQVARRLIVTVPVYSGIVDVSVGRSNPPASPVGPFFRGLARYGQDITLQLQ